MYCNNCGAKLEDGDSFCGNCGKAVNMENNTKPEEVQQNVVENTQVPTQTVQQEVPQPVKQTAVENSQIQQASHTQPQSQPNANNSTGYKSSKATFDSSKIILTIVLGIVFFIIGFVCCKHYIARKVNNYLDDYYYNDYDYSDYNYDNYDNYDYDNNSYDDNNHSESTSSSNNNNNNSLNYTECSISNDDGTKVTLKLPSTLEISTSSSDVDYKTIKKVDEDSELTVTISVEDETIDEAIAEVREEYADEEYKNVKLSDVKTMTVGDRTYSYIEVEYYLNNMEFKYTSKYLVTAIDSNTLYGVVLEEYEDLTDRELTDLLTINVTK